MINGCRIPPPPLPIYLKSKYGLAFLARAFAVQNLNHYLCCFISDSTNGALSVWLGSFFALSWCSVHAKWSFRGPKFLLT